jgi:hypothetical protein
MLRPRPREGAPRSDWGTARNQLMRDIDLIELSNFCPSQPTDLAGYGGPETDSRDCSTPWAARRGGLPGSIGLSDDKGCERFLKGPVPLAWLQAAARLPGRSLHVGMVLWYVAGLSGWVSVHLSNVLCLRFGLDRKRQVPSVALARARQASRG